LVIRACDDGIVRKLTITDVTNKDVRVMVSEAQPKIENGRLKTKSPEVLVSRANTPWIYNSDAMTTIFRIDIEDDDGKIETLLQASYVPAFEKAKFRKIVDLINPSAAK
jgi:hypothetical protein